MTRGAWLRLTPISAASVLILAFAAGGPARPRAQQTPQAPVPAPGWTLVYDHPFPGKNEDFAFPNSRDGWLVNARGEIMHSSDSGATWTMQATGKGSLRSIDFLDDKRGFAGTLSGVLYGTFDGGATWTDITATLPRKTIGFCGATHVGERVHIVGRYSGGAADYFFSPDGGKTWTGASLRDIAYGLVDVSFLNESIGFIGGMANSEVAGTGPATILKTTDGGRTWRTVFTHDGGRGFAWKLFPISATLIYASLQTEDGTYRIAKSTDSGDTWTVMIAATGRSRGPGVQGIGFLDDRHGWIGGFFQGMFETTDGGQTWTEVTTTERMINRFERVGGTLFTASTRGVLRYDPPPKLQK